MPLSSGETPASIDGSTSVAPASVHVSPVSGLSDGAELPPQAASTVARVSRTTSVVIAVGTRVRPWRPLGVRLIGEVCTTPSPDAMFATESYPPQGAPRDAAIEQPRGHGRERRGQGRHDRAAAGCPRLAGPAAVPGQGVHRAGDRLPDRARRRPGRVVAVRARSDAVPSRGR